MEPLQVKLSDFGLSKVVQHDETLSKNFCGTLLYCAPKVFPYFEQSTTAHQQWIRTIAQLRRWTGCLPGNSSTTSSSSDGSYLSDRKWIKKLNLPREELVIMTKVRELNSELCHLN